MICPFCQHEETKVTDKRDIDSITKRRRECLKCKKRFTTIEKVKIDLDVIKKDGRKEKFDVNKIKKGIEKALEKRPVDSEKIEEFVSEVESKIYKISKGKEVSSLKIGEIVMNKLKSLDKVAYIRFASVYREFADLDDFKKEINEALRRNGN